MKNDKQEIQNVDRRFTMKNKTPLIMTLVFAAGLSLVLFNALSKAQAHTDTLSTDNNVSLQKVEVHQNDVQTELCIFLPSIEQWGPFATLSIDGEIVTNSEIALIDPKDPKTATSQTRCYRFTFPITVIPEMPKTAVLKLENLTADYHGGLLTNAGLTTAQKRLHETQPLIDFTVIIEKGDGGGGAYIQILSKPDGMNDDQVMKLIQQASIVEFPMNWQEVINLKQ